MGVSKSVLATNLGGVADWSVNHPFIDKMKEAKQWENVESLELDESGWPLRLREGQVAATYICRTATPVYRDYTVLYSGKGKVGYRFSATKNSENSVFGRDVITIAPGNALLCIEETDPSDPIKDIRIIPTHLLDHYERGEIFNPEFKEKIARFSGIRFMGWTETNNSTQKVWADRPKVNDRTWGSGTNGVPYEICMQLANELDSTPWVCIPHGVDADYVRRMAEACKAHLAGHLKIRNQYSNEVWNWKFKHCTEVVNTAREFFGSDDKSAFRQYCGMMAAKCGRVFKEVFGDSRAICVLGTQTSNTYMARKALDAPLWVAMGGEKPDKDIDELAIAPYFYGGVHVPEFRKDGPAHFDEIRNWMNAGEEGFSKVFDQLWTGNPLREISDITDWSKSRPYETYTGFADKLRKEIRANLAEAKSRGIKLVGYEGGTHIAPLNGAVGETQFVDWLVAINNRPEMKAVYAEMLRVWHEETEGATLYHFLDISPHDKSGSWGALNHLKQETSPRWEALMEFSPAPVVSDPTAPEPPEPGPIAPEPGEPDVIDVEPVEAIEKVDLAHFSGFLEGAISLFTSYKSLVDKQLK